MACTPQLLASVAGVDSLEHDLKAVRGASHDLRQDINRIRQDTLLPFRELQKRVLLLGRCQQANVLTKRVLRFLFDAKKLRNQVE